MAGITVTAAQLSGIIGHTITAERFDAVRAVVLGLIATEYRRDISLATGREAEVLNSVFVSASVRLLSNPTGARSVTVGGANITFGGSDRNMSDSAILTDSEKDMLWSLRKPRANAINLTPPTYTQNYYTEPYWYSVT